MSEGVINRKADAEVTIDSKVLEDAIRNVLKSDSPRVEPARNARVEFYNTFQREVNEYDRNFLGKWNADLDTSLVPASLFSAVTSAFMLAVQIQLQPDYTQLSYDILWIVANSTDLKIPARPSTYSAWTGPDPTLVEVQIILFSSLALSLLTTFVAILGKQWLNSYSQVNVQSSLIDQSRDRQLKMDGMVAWRFDVVMESLPLMLQTALLLLCCALARYLFTIDDKVAWAVVGFTTIGSLLYSFIVVAATLYYNCPFKTPLALVIRIMVRGLGRKRLNYLKRSRRWLRHILAKTKERRGLSSGNSYPWDTYDGFNVDDAGNRVEIRMVGPPSLFGEDTGRGGNVLDSNCIVWLFKMSTDAEVLQDIMRLIPDVVWYDGVQTPPLEKLYDIILECFDQSSEHPVVIPRFRAMAYLSAKALVHIVVQHTFVGIESDMVVLDSISRRHTQSIGSRQYEGDSDLESTLGMIDRVFGPQNMGPMDWHKFSLSVPHHTWMGQILFYRAWGAIAKGEPLPGDVKGFILHTLRLDSPPPAIVTLCLVIIHLILGIRLQTEDKQVTDRGQKTHSQITKIYEKLVETFWNIDPATCATDEINRALEAMELITPLSGDDIATKSSQLFHNVMQAPTSPAFTDEVKWGASRFALHGARKWNNIPPAVANPECILTFLVHHFELATQHGEKHDEPIKNALDVLAYASDPITIQALEDFDPTQPAFVCGIRYVFQRANPLQLRMAALRFFPRVSDKWFNAPRLIMTPYETQNFSVDWATAVDEVEGTDDIRNPALIILFNMVNSPHWRPHIVADKWKLLEHFISDPDDSQPFRRCLENPEVVDAIWEGGNQDAIVLWSTILLLRYKDLKNEVLQRFAVAVKGASRRELEGYMSAVQSKQKEAELESASFTTWSTDPRAAALKREIRSHVEAREFLESYMGAIADP